MARTTRKHLTPSKRAKRSRKELSKDHKQRRVNERAKLRKEYRS